MKRPSAETTTNLNGEYFFPHQPPGTYKACWEKLGFIAACGPNFTIASATAFAGDLPVQTAPASIVGRVSLKDGSACRTLNHFFKIDVFTTVKLVDGSNTEIVPAVRANSFGDYVLAGVPVHSKGLVIEATCENAHVQQGVALISGNMSVDLTLPNSRPVITSATASINGKGVRMVALGASVDALIQASDPEGDPIHYRWGALDGNGNVVSADAASVPWKLPAVPGTHLLYVAAFDNKGGYVFDQVPLMVGSSGVGFSGVVIDETTGHVISGASVTVVDSADKQDVLTDAHGFFYLGIKEDPGARYVLNIHKAGYAFLSRIFDNATYGGKYPLAKAFQMPCDPNSDITLVDKGPETPAVKQARAAIIIKGKTLVDKNGKPAPGPLTCSISTLDPSLRPLPGDYRAKDDNGKDQSLVSYGAVFGEFSDAAGNLYNLASGATATVVSPVPAGLQASAPAKVPVWSYDESTGFWMQEKFGPAVLKNQGGMVYTFETTHFSYLNTDVAKTGQPTCIRVELDPNGHLAAGLTLQVRIPTAPAYQQLQHVTLDNDQFHAIFRLPWSNPPSNPPHTVTLEPLDSQGQPIAAAVQTIDLDARPQMIIVNNNLWPDYPFSECGDPILLGIKIPAFAVASGGTPAYLTGIGNSIPDPSVVDPQKMTNAYYDAIDPNKLRLTLGQWWGLNGFDANTGANGTRASYLNNNDLGFGRDMHCVQSGGNTACYVTNYGDSDQNPGNADLANTANTALPPNQGGPIATVAMEYAPVEGQGSTKIVKFFVFQGGSKDGARQVAANLDHNGAKPVPQLCMVCHGGDYHPANNAYLNPTFADVNFGASFREFDLQSFKYTGFRADFNLLSGPELSNFHTLNNIVNATNPAPAISEIIGKWYQGGGDKPDYSNLPSSTVSWVPIPERPLYLNVVSQSCRTCHIAKPGGRTDIVFNTYDLFYNAKPLIGPPVNRVCGTQKLMPNAKITFNNFWNSTSPSRPATLAAFDDPTRWDPALGVCQ